MYLIIYTSLVFSLFELLLKQSFFFSIYLDGQPPQGSQFKLSHILSQGCKIQRSKNKKFSCKT